MKLDRTRLYDDEVDFYSLGGSVVMKLTPAAAFRVCNTASDHGLVVARVEGGVWHRPGFEARYDCIWDGADPPLSVEAAATNNCAAAAFVKRMSLAHSAFVLTTPPIAGWPHRATEVPRGRSDDT